MSLDALNPAQLEAVRAPLGPQFIIAGAGSGKTRVLTHRLAYLVGEEKIPPFNILAVTFTNKAANEMRLRIDSLLNTSSKAMWIGTFHGLSHRFLRQHWREANLPQSFQILDSEDQFRMIKRVIQALQLDEDRFPVKEAQWFINGQKEEGKEPHEVMPRDLNAQTHLKIYQAYDAACQRSGVIDFADLLLKTYKLMQTHAQLRTHYQNRFRCLLVDEFQDTNTIQYNWLKLFAGDHNALMIVGDDDQSIYGWRGARIENIQRFSRDYPQAQVIRLEQNYRSTGTILKAANALISQNTGRLGKNLWTEGSDGEKITIYCAFNDADEAFYIVHRMRALLATGINYRDMAVLYRSNAQSRIIEEALMQLGIPYRIYGGLRFFDRAEIKDALHYLRLVMNLADDSALERIINTPTRGIGERTVSMLREHGKNTNSSMWHALQQLLTQKQFTARTEAALLHFVNLITGLQEKITDLPLHKQVELVINDSGLIEHFQKEKGDKGAARIENLEELINAAHQFTQETTFEDMSPLSAFLSSAALESSQDEMDAHENAAQLMTLHSAKGLEFPVVFLAGCEEDLFPHYFSLEDPKKLEEERRLCYVGMTRAMHKLFMTYAEMRRMHGREAFHQPSRFLQEIPEKFVEHSRFGTKVSRPQAIASSPRSKKQQTTASGKFYAGAKVNHKIFGKGTVLECEGDDEESMKVTVRFSQVGIKKILSSFLSREF